MSKRNKQQAAANKAIAKENQTALKVFNAKGVSEAVKAISASRLAGDEAKSIGATAAMLMMDLTARFIEDANTAHVTDTATQLENWIANIKVLSVKLAGEGHPAAAVTKDKDGNVTGAKLVGYPANVATTARGVVEYGINIKEVEAKDADKGVSYRDIAAAVKVEKASRQPADIIKLKAALADCRDAFNDLFELITQDDDVLVINTLTDALIVMRIKAAEDIATMDKLEQEARDVAIDEATAHDVEQEQETIAA